MRHTRQEEGGGGGRRMLPALLLAGLCAASCASAQVYKWTDAQGTVHYGDAPPPQRPSSQLTTPAQDGAAAQAALPYELARAVKASPVTLYTTTQSACAGCEQGRLLLRKRGVPFAEKTVDTDDDKEGLRQLSGKLELPLLVVGSRQVAGFQEAAWQDALTAAAYPRTTQLPPGYRYGAPAPAAPASAPGTPFGVRNPAPPDEAAAQAAGQQPRRPAARDIVPAQKQQPPTGKAPPGFQF